MDVLLDLQLWVSLLTLTALEIVLGIDNLVFLSILSNRLPAHQQKSARRIGLALAVITRLLLLFSIAWLASVTQPLFTIAEHAVSLRDLVLIGGGLFLLAKGTTEIHTAVEGIEEEMRQAKASRFTSVVVQIMTLDIVFSLDSVITAVGMANHIAVMAAAIIIAVIVMLFASEPLARFIAAHLSVKLLALAFLILVGVALIADGMGFHIPKGYLYFAIAFSVGVEALNLYATRSRRAKHRAEGVKNPYEKATEKPGR
jgi:predicted tellurium resistance membrane protein TerC